MLQVGGFASCDITADSTLGGGGLDQGACMTESRNKETRWKDSLLFEVKERGNDSSNTLVCNDISELPQVTAQVICKGSAHSEGLESQRRDANGDEPNDDM